MTAPKHPAKFSPQILTAIRVLVEREVFMLDANLLLLDPFAGVGGIHELGVSRVTTFGLELEEEWANMHPRTKVGDALKLPWQPRSFHIVATSPCYGNRMADHHNATDTSKRNTYRHVLGRELSEGSAASMQWGSEYRDFHRRAWVEARRVLRDGGLFIVNVKNHIRRGEEMLVAEWHLKTLLGLGFKLEAIEWVEARGNRQGENGDVRVAGEWVMAVRK